MAILLTGLIRSLVCNYKTTRYLVPYSDKMFFYLCITAIEISA